MSQTTNVTGQLAVFGAGNLTVTGANTDVNLSGNTKGAPGAFVQSNTGTGSLTLKSVTSAGDDIYAAGASGATGATLNIGTVTSNNAMVLEVLPGETSPSVQPAAAINVVGGTGTASVTNTTATASGVGGHGITASAHDVIVNSGTVTTTGAAFTDTSTGINYVPYGIAAVSTGGNIQVTSGTINTAGVIGDGIYARANGAAGDTINVTSTSMTLTGDGAVGVNAAATGNVTVNAGSIETDGQTINYSNVYGGDVGQTVHTANDIRAISTGGAVNLSVTTAKALGGNSGAIYGSANGDLTMTLGAVTANSGTGTLTTAGVYGESVTGNQHDIFNGLTQGQTEAVALVDDANKTVTVDVNPSGGTGAITATGTALHILDNGSTAAASGSVVVNNSGSISGGTTGILINTNAGTGAGVTINNHGAISGGTNAISLVGSTDDTLNIFTGSSITGTADLGAGTDTVNLIGTSNTKTNTQTFGNIVGSETLDVQSGYWTQVGAMPASTATIETGATLETVALDGPSGLLTTPTGSTQQIIDNGNLVLTTSDTNAYSYGGVISGSGGVNVAGAGVLTLTGANTYTGATDVQAGGLIVTSSLSSSAVNVASGLQFNYANAVSQTFAGNITGAGSFAKTGVGNLSFGGVAGNTGGFTVNAGTLTDIGTINGAVAIVSGATLSIGAGGAAGAVNGNIADNGTLILNRSDDVVIADVVSGAGNLTKTGANTVTLTGANFYAGATNVQQGGLVVTNAAAGAAVLISGGASFTVANVSDQILGATISGAGDFNKAGPATLLYTGNDSATGLMNLNGGTLVVTGFIHGNVNVASGTTLKIGDPFGDVGGAVAGNIADASAVIFNGSQLNYLGVISGAGSVTQAGPNTLTFTGANTYTGLTTVSGGGLVVSGSLAGSVSVGAAGTLSIGAGGATGSIAGNIANDGTLNFNRSDAVTYGGVISGSGAVNVSGALTLTGANTNTGVTTIASGSKLAVGAGGTAGSITGNVANSGAVIFNRSDALTYAGNIMGSGSLTQAGTGTLTLAGANTIGAGTTVAAGTLIDSGTLTSNVTVNSGATLQIGDGGTTGTLAGSLVDNGTAIFNRSDSYSFGGAFSGNGSLIKQGAGVLTLTGAYTFSGTTTVQGGSVNIAQISSTGTLALGAGSTVNLSSGGQTIGGLSGVAGSSLTLGGTALTINNAGASNSFGGAVSGTGSLTFTGTGTTDLTGVNPFSGATEVDGGTLKINGSINSNTTVGNGGTLGGAGTINGSVNVASGGTLSPGNSPGVITINGGLTLASGSTTIIEVDPTAVVTHDQINVTGAATVTAGAKLAVHPLGAITNYAYTQLYPIITATGGVTGTFAKGDITTSMAFLQPFLHYSANEVDLQLVRNDITFAGVASTPNQTAVATAAEATGPGATPFDSIIGQDAAGARAGFNAMSGETYGAIGSFLIGQSRHQRDSLLDRATGDADRGAWAQVFDATNHANGTANSASGTDNETGIAGGADASAGSWTFGLGLTYMNSDINQTSLGSKSTVKTYGGGLYAGTKVQGFKISIGGDYEQNQVDAKRAIVFPTVAQNVAGSYDAHTSQVFVEAAYPTHAGGFDVTPFADLAEVWLRSDAFNETGGTLALGVSDQSRNVLLTDLGARISGHWETGGFTLYPEASIAWRHASGDTKGLSGAAFGTSAFTVQGADLATNAAAIKAGVSADIGKGGKVWLDYDGVLGNANTSNGVKLGAAFKF